MKTDYLLGAPFNGVKVEGSRTAAEKIHPRTISEPSESGEPVIQPKKLRRESAENILAITAMAVDFAMIVGGFALAVWLQAINFPPHVFNDGARLSTLNACKLISLGALIISWDMIRRNLYAYKCLLHPLKNLNKFAAALGIVLIGFTGIKLIFQTDPALSIKFISGTLLLCFLNVFGWRLLLSRIIRHPGIAAYLHKRLVVVGAGMQTMQIKKALEENSELKFVGWIPANKPNHVVELEPYRLGPLHELRQILHKHAIDVAVLTESDSLQREGVLAVAKACETEHVHFKMVPHFFEILISGLRPDMIGGTQVLGVEALPLNGYRNRTIKRTIDIAGAIFGLVLSAPLISVFGFLVYLESPGPIFYKQVRMGKNGHLFNMTKIRSMRLDAESPGKVQWATPNDQRRLKIGTFIRKWNIDEVPQFWNVLKGEMSLVGPRPERPELISRFRFKIPHYQVRHTCRPGMTGWAQVNGWRGNTDLEKRIYHDIWYVESWSLLLDFKIMFLTFFRKENAY